MLSSKVQTRQSLKVHCHANQCFYVDFLRSKMAARRLEAAAPANEKQAYAALFFFFTCSELRDRSTSELQYQSVTLAKSFIFRTKLGFEIWSRKWKQKGKFTLNNAEISWNPKQACRAPRINLELSWSDDRSRPAIFQVQLCIFRYTVQCTQRESTGGTLVKRASFGKMHGRHYFSPQQNGAKNHWIAWQCTFNMPGGKKAECLWTSVAHWVYHVCRK